MAGFGTLTSRRESALRNESSPKPVRMGRGADADQAALVRGHDAPHQYHPLGRLGEKLGGLEHQAAAEPVPDQHQVLQPFPLHGPRDGLDAIVQAHAGGVSARVGPVARQVHGIDVIGPPGLVKGRWMFLRGSHVAPDPPPDPGPLTGSVDQQIVGHSASAKARNSGGSSSGSTVRGSNSTRSSSMRATTGGVF